MDLVLFYFSFLFFILSFYSFFFIVELDKEDKM